MILLTGAAGKTGLALTRALTAVGQPVRAFVRTPQQASAAQAAGATETFLGDLLNPDDLNRAAEGARALYLICPNVHPQEVQIGRLAIAAARHAGLELIAYHSVLHPQIQAMPHHWQKMQVEAALIESGLPFLILQPCAYMQNILHQKETILASGTLEVPCSLETRHSLVHLEDVAIAAARLLTSPVYLNGSYELAGPQALNHHEIAALLAQTWGQPITPRQLTASEWQAAHLSLPAYARDTLLAMFAHYDQHGFTGSPAVLQAILGRAPTPLANAASP